MKTIRNLFSLALAGVALLLGGCNAGAQNVIGWENFSYSTAPTSFSGIGVTNPIVANQSNLVWFCTSAKGVGVPRMENIYGLQGDLALANAAVTFWSSTNACSATNLIAGTNFVYCDTNGFAFASNDLAIIQYYTNDVYQLVTVTNVGANFIGVSPATKYALGGSDIVYRLVQIGSLLEPGVNATNVPCQGQNYLISGRQGYPLAVTLAYSNSAKIRLVTGTYGDRQPNRHW